MELRNQNAVVHMHTSERMPEVDDGSVKLMLCSCTHLGGWQTWPDYNDLICRVVAAEGRRKLREDGYLLVFQTDAYIDGKLMPRGQLLLSTLTELDFGLLDAKVWRRKRADLRQPPWSHVFVMRPGAGTARRPHPSNKPYFQGVWEYGQTARGKLNSWPDDLCQLMVETFTEPGDLVVDPFAGSARLLGVASSLGRHGVGYEINESLAPLIEESLS